MRALSAGFSYLDPTAGFSFFRAPARWTLATNLALALLAGRGFDSLFAWPKPGRAVRRFAIASLAAVVVVVGGFELALASAQGNGGNPAASGFGFVLGRFPWSDQPGEKPFRAVMAEAYRPQSDLRVQSALARLYGKPPAPPGPTLAGERFSIYALELGETGVLLVALVLLSALSRRPRVFATGLLALTFADGLVQASHRPFDLGPCRPLVDQSAMLARMAREPRGTRVLDPARNLFLVAGVDSVSSYRTLDLPAASPLLQVARGPVDDRRVADALRLAGVQFRVLDPFESRSLLVPFRDKSISGSETIVADPTLAGWLYGVDLARSFSLQEFVLLTSPTEPSKAWLMPTKGLAGLDIQGDPFPLLEKFRLASPLPTRSDLPERAEIDVKVADSSPSMVVISKTYDPEWEAWWSNEAGDRRPAQVVKVLGRLARRGCP